MKKCEKCGKEIADNTVEGKDYYVGYKYALYGYFPTFCKECVEVAKKNRGEQ